MSFAFGITKRFDFRVGQTGTMMPTFSDHFPSLYENRANHRVGRRCAVTALREF